jgi:hypothetical protein
LGAGDRQWVGAARDGTCVVVPEGTGKLAKRRSCAHSHQKHEPERGGRLMYVDVVVVDRMTSVNEEEGKGQLESSLSGEVGADGKGQLDGEEVSADDKGQLDGEEVSADDKGQLDGEEVAPKGSAAGKKRVSEGGDLSVRV